MTHVENRGGGNGGLRPHLGEAAAVDSTSADGGAMAKASYARTGEAAT
jgi:hypothetical protein